MTLKNILQTAYSFFFHPILSIRFVGQGAKWFFIGPRLKINHSRCLKVKSGLQIGKDSKILLITAHIGRLYPTEVIIGENVCIGDRFSMCCAGTITIGRRCLIASDVLITSENHGLNFEEAGSFAMTPLQYKPVSIGEGCWIGEKATILPGVSLGDHCVVAAGAVVTKSFPAATMLAGVPAKAIKKYNYETHAWEACSNTF